MFNALKMLRELIDDNQLTTTQRYVMLVMIAHTDNTTGAITVSQGRIAKTAGVGRSTVYRVIHSEAGQRYFQTVRKGRYVDLIWRSSCVTKTQEPVSQRHTIYVLPTSGLCSESKPLPDDYQSGKEWMEAVGLWNQRSMGA